MAALNKAQRILLVLEHLTSAPTPPTHAELVRALEIHRSTLWDLLADLRSAGYVDVIDHRYVLGPRMLALVYRAARHGHLDDAVEPTLRALAGATGETAVYVVEIGSTGADPGYCVPVAQVESPNYIRYAATLGRPFAHLTTAAGRLFLAFGPRAPAEILAGVADAPPSITLAELEHELERVRVQGYALSSPESPTPAIAAPVFDPEGTVVGAIALMGPPDRFENPERAWPTLERELRAMRQRQPQREPHRAPDAQG